MKISYAVFCLKKKNEIAALAASERRDADLDRLFAALSTMRFFFNDTATTEIYTLSLHDALPICVSMRARRTWCMGGAAAFRRGLP